ncbi:hypothetical protein CLF_109709 [Clonorchis sinensis]|uniref:Uncharacterized protein n=1 Tax=Clonorchis sinensis TaxID=79923 RepID=G7YSW1_CLOSI|nr:hypothetical protein CLF_109709 [Clonorchis sinensis]
MRRLGNKEYHNKMSNLQLKPVFADDKMKKGETDMQCFSIFCNYFNRSELFELHTLRLCEKFYLLNTSFDGRIKLTLVSLLIMANSLLSASAVGKFGYTMDEKFSFRKCLQECALSAEPLLDEYDYCVWQCSRLREKRGKFFMMGR